MLDNSIVIQWKHWKTLENLGLMSAMEWNAKRLKKSRKLEFLMNGATFSKKVVDNIKNVWYNVYIS